MSVTPLLLPFAKRLLWAVLTAGLLATMLTGCSSESSGRRLLPSLLTHSFAPQCSEDFATDYREVDKRIREVLAADADESVSEEDFQFTILNVDMACKRFFSKHQRQLCKMTVVEGEDETVVDPENFAEICEEAASYADEMKEGVPENPEAEIPVDELAKILLKDIQPKSLNFVLLKPEPFKEALLSSKEKPVMMVYGEVVSESTARADLDQGATSCILISEDQKRWEKSEMGQVFQIDQVKIESSNGRQSSAIKMADGLVLACTKKSQKPLNLEDLQASVSGILRIEKAN